jgi:ribonuclease D
MFDYIATDLQLETLLQQLDSSTWLTLDTEFIRENTYFPKLCLIQIATENVVACIDPLSIQNLQPLFVWLADPKRVKVLHSAWQDLELLYHISGGLLPTPIFDTQVAAAILGMGDQVGYGRLVEVCLGVDLEKSQARTDWAQRPLTPKQLEYAIDDVRYLRDVYLFLQHEIKRLGREQWLTKALHRLVDSQTYAVDINTSWQRVRNLQILKPAQLAVLRELAKWREQYALQHNIPRRWIVNDELLLELARKQPQSIEAIKVLRGMSEDLAKQYASDWLQCIQAGKAVDKANWPQLPKRRKLDADLQIVADLLMLLLQKIAQEHELAPQLIATRPQIEKMLIENRTQLAEDWRGALVNDTFQAVLQGQMQVAVLDQQLQLLTVKASV